MLLLGPYWTDFLRLQDKDLLSVIVLTVAELSKDAAHINMSGECAVVNGTAQFTEPVPPVLQLPPPSIARGSIVKEGERVKVTLRVELS
jgi:hypothetical protein